MPNILYCIGAQKAGTTWLFRILQNIGAVEFPMRKEAHYWDWVELGKRPRQDDVYWSQLGASAAAPYCGDFTPDYAVLDAVHIQAIVSAAPGIQVVFVLRDPVERAWSAAKMAADYAKLSDAEISTDWLHTVALSKESQKRGDYAHTIRQWLRFLPPSQLHIVGFGDIRDKPRETICWLLERLGLSSNSFLQSGLGLHTPFNTGRALPLPMPLRVTLMELYSPRKVELVRCLNDYKIPFDIENWRALPTS